MDISLLNKNFNKNISTKESNNKEYNNINKKNIQIASIKMDIDNTTNWINNILGIPEKNILIEQYTTITINDIEIHNTKLPICQIYNNNLYSNNEVNSLCVLSNAIKDNFVLTKDEYKNKKHQLNQNKLIERKLNKKFKHLIDEYKNYCSTSNVSNNEVFGIDIGTNIVATPTYPSIRIETKYIQMLDEYFNDKLHIPFINTSHNNINFSLLYTKLINRLEILNLMIKGNNNNKLIQNSNIDIETIDDVKSLLYGNEFGKKTVK